MFGYVMPEKAHLYMKDFDLYRSFYCGVCKSMERQFGQLSRFTINYDITFLAILLHNYLGVDVTFERLRCITKPFTQRKSVESNELTDMLASFNVILGYYAAYDKALDDNSTKARSAMRGLKKALKKASENLTGVEEIVKTRYASLREVEKTTDFTLDKISDEFASMMRDCVKAIVTLYASKHLVEKENPVCYNDGDAAENNIEGLSHLSYNVGKWIYMIDALDDFEDDVKENKFNPFKVIYSGVSTHKELMEKHGEEIVFAFASCLNAINDSFLKIKFSFNKDFLANVIQKGLPLMTKGVMQGEKCKNTYTKFLV